MSTNNSDEDDPQTEEHQDSEADQEIGGDDHHQQEDGNDDDDQQQEDDDEDSEDYIEVEFEIEGSISPSSPLEQSLHSSTNEEEEDDDDDDGPQDQDSELMPQQEQHSTETDLLTREYISLLKMEQNQTRQLIRLYARPLPPPEEEKMVSEMIDKCYDINYCRNLEILKAMLAYQSRTGDFPNLFQLRDFLENHTKVEIKISDGGFNLKVLAMQAKFQSVVLEKGLDHEFYNDRHKELFRLSKEIWGPNRRSFRF